MYSFWKLVDKLSQDEANKIIVIHDHPAIVKLEEKARSCWDCGSLNCLIKQNICAQQKIKRQTLGKCTGKKRTFGNNTYFAQTGKPKPKPKRQKKQKPEATESTTNISTPRLSSDDEAGAYGGSSECEVAMLNRQDTLQVLTCTSSVLRPSLHPTMNPKMNMKNFARPSKSSIASAPNNVRI